VCRVEKRRRSIVAAPHARLEGRLAVISTPIGNLGDLSPRARDELSAAELVAAEDTRRTGQLLTTLGLTRPLVSLHEHNERERIEELLEKLRGGAHIALVSDAGTPLLSDPGFELVRRVSGEGITVVAVPGPSAITAALSVAGLPTERFSFEGFLPARLAERRARLAELATEMRTQVYFEAPHRITEMLDDMSGAFGAARRAAVARELTKVFETVYRGTLAELCALARGDPNFTRGEITVVVEGAPRAAPGDGARAALDAALRALLSELAPSKAASVAARLTGARRNEAYARALELAAEGDAKPR
jgi:16S rRNA (cytidine1402-2'-O)-methyltransferase